MEVHSWFGPWWQSQTSSSVPGVVTESGSSRQRPEAALTYSVAVLVPGGVRSSWTAPGPRLTL